MAVKKSGLGKGLDSLIAPKTRPEQKTQTTSAAVKPEKETIVKTVVKKEEVKLRISEVEPNREQPRKKFDEDALLIQFGSLECCNHCLYRNGTAIMRSSQGNAVGVQQRWQD